MPMPVMTTLRILRSDQLGAHRLEIVERHVRRGGAPELDPELLLGLVEGTQQRDGIHGQVFQDLRVLDLRALDVRRGIRLQDVKKLLSQLGHRRTLLASFVFGGWKSDSGRRKERGFRALAGGPNADDKLKSL